MTGAVDVVDLLRRAVSNGDEDGAATLITRHPLEIWFRMPPSEVQLIVHWAEGALARRGGIGALALAGFFPDRATASPHGDAREAAEEDRITDPAVREIFRFAHTAHARLAGDPERAFAAAQKLPSVRTPVVQVIDPSRGQRAFIVGQTGVSAMLAGSFQQALALLDKALISPVPPTLAFLHRDAHLRIALIHALYGDLVLARRHLTSAQSISRTDSWSEEVLDTDERLVRLLLAGEDDPDAAFTDLLQIPLSEMREMWPFHALAAQHLGMTTGRIAQMYERTQQLRDAGFAGADRSGYAGSVLAHTFALHAMLAGASSTSEQLLARAGADYWETSAIAAGLALIRGAVPSAIGLLHGIAARTRGLRRADTFRRMVLAVAHDVDGAQEEAEAILAELTPHVDRLTATMLIRFAPKFAARAIERVPGWPAATEPLPSNGTLRRQGLTARELDVLHHLARGMSRGEIARALYITVNTIKTHQRSLYRKLGATTREHAILEARRRALL